MNKENLQKSFKNLSATFKNYSSVKRGLIIATLVLMTPLIIGCQSQKADKSATGEGDKISFVKQAQSKGPYVWLRAESKEGLGKDAVVNTIYVMKNGKTTTYQIYNRITLGQLSKKSDKAIISLAEQENKKFATTGAIADLNYEFNNTHYDGQQRDFEGFKYIRYEMNYQTQYTDLKINPTTFKYIAESEDPNPDLENGGRAYLSDLYSVPLNGDSDQGYFKAIIQHIKESKYKAPTAGKIKVDNDTDNSGNTIVSQSLSYTLINYFNKKAIQENVDAYFIKHPNEAIKLIDASNASESSDSTNVEENIKEANDLYLQFIKDKYSLFTEDAYQRNKVTFTMSLKAPLSQDIYNKRYIGYTTGSASDYVVTKAQNDQEEAVLAK